MRFRKKPKKKMSRTAKTLWTGALCVVAGVGIYVGYLYNKADAALEAMSAPPVKVVNTGLTEEVPEEENRPLTFLLTGVDNREGSGGSMNTDVIMIAAWNPKDKAVTLVSIPRDAQLKPKKLGSHKANYYYAYYYNKDRDTAIENTKEFYSELLGLPIDHMAVINFDGFRQVVDRLGGLEIDVDMDMRYVDNFDGTNINLKKGLQKLDGKQTLDFLRYRKSNRGTAESSDFERNARQQLVLEQLISKMASVSGAFKLGDLLTIAGNSVKTDIPADTLKDWLFSIKELKPEHIEMITMEGVWESPYVVIDDEEWDRVESALKVRLGLEAGTMTAGSNDRDDEDDRSSSTNSVYNEGSRKPGTSASKPSSNSGASAGGTTTKPGASTGSGTVKPGNSGSSRVTDTVYSKKATTKPEAATGTERTTNKRETADPVRDSDERGAANTVKKPNEREATDTVKKSNEREVTNTVKKSNEPEATDTVKKSNERESTDSAPN